MIFKEYTKSIGIGSIAMTGIKEGRITTQGQKIYLA